MTDVQPRGAALVLVVPAARAANAGTKRRLAVRVLRKSGEFCWQSLIALGHFSVFLPVQLPQEYFEVPADAVPSAAPAPVPSRAMSKSAELALLAHLDF
jgi:hypothetical protein